VRAAFINKPERRNAGRPEGWEEAQKENTMNESPERRKAGTPEGWEGRQQEDRRAGRQEE